MNKLILGSVVGVAALSGGVLAVAGRTEERIRAATFVGPVAVGEMTPAAADLAIRAWWEKEGLRALPISWPAGNRARTPKELGIGLDVAATLAQAPRKTLFEFFNKPTEKTRIVPVLNVDTARLEPLAKAIDASLVRSEPAKVFYQAGKFKRVPEAPSLAVDKEKLQAEILDAISSHSAVKVPLVAAAKKVSDSDLASIAEVVSEFSTRFSTGKRSRCANIRLAASKLDGLVLMPGDRVSFNGVVGRRTQKNGFQIAGVYKNGKHDIDVGGGICQVSSTLYNSAVFANLRIVERQNHSMPVPYVPVGRDATVDYGAIDLVIENNLERPIALDSEYRPGKLTFRILGTKDPSLDVKVESEGHKSWDAGTQLVVDPTLPSGARKVVEKGTSAHSITTYRLVYKEGKLVLKERLGRSYYRGGKRIIAVGKTDTPEEPKASKPSMRLASAELH